MTRLQTLDTKGKHRPACGGFIAVTAGDRNNETAVLRAVDRRCRVRAEETRDIDVAHFKQTRIIGTGKFSAGIAFRGNIVQAHGG